MAHVTLENDDRGFGSSFYVWLQMEAGDPTEQSESFIVGSGKTPAEALAEAINEVGILQTRLKKLFQQHAQETPMAHEGAVEDPEPGPDPNPDPEPTLPPAAAAQGDGDPGAAVS